MTRSHIAGLHVGDTATFSTRGGIRVVSGKVTRLEIPEYQNDYATVILDSDGMEYHFGTGGHFVTSWTTEDGSAEWFLEA